MEVLQLIAEASPNMNGGRTGIGIKTVEKHRDISSQAGHS